MESEESANLPDLVGEVRPEFSAYVSWTSATCVAEGFADAAGKVRQIA